ncbi:MAG: hypothetical protein ABFD59_08265 [Smithella sp.]
MREHLTDINGVFEDEKEIKIAMPVKLKMDQGRIKIEVGCSFVLAKLDDTSTGWVDEQQLDLPLSGPSKQCPLNPGESRLVSFCQGSCKLRRMDIYPEPSSAEPEVPFVQFRSCAAWADQHMQEFIENLIKDCPEPRQPFAWEPTKKGKVLKMKNAKA